MNEASSHLIAWKLLYVINSIFFPSPADTDSMLHLSTRRYNGGVTPGSAQYHLSDTLTLLSIKRVTPVWIHLLTLFHLALCSRGYSSVCPRITPYYTPIYISPRSHCPISISGLIVIEIIRLCGVC